jgi:hypothetical protein
MQKHRLAGGQRHRPVPAAANAHTSLKALVDMMP